MAQTQSGGSCASETGLVWNTRKIGLEAKTKVSLIGQVGIEWTPFTVRLDDNGQRH
jgi:hypothetical protein